MYITVNGVKLYYEKHGGGQPMILSHCNSMTHKIFDKAVKILQSRYTVYAVDSRDHGKSEPVKTLHYEDMAEDMRQFIETLEMEKPVFYGFSDGAIVGILLAAENPNLLSKLIISGASLNPQSTKEFPLKFFRFWSHIDRSDKMQIMLREPNITDEMLKKITVPTFVTCGSRDLIKQSDTEHIASVIPGAKLKIFEGESHSSYIVNNEKIVDYILNET